MDSFGFQKSLKRTNSFSSLTSAYQTDVYLMGGGGDLEKVARVNVALKKRGLTTCFDEERTTGTKMTEGIDNAKVVVTFLTQDYVQKVNGIDDHDNSRYEFTYAMEVKGPEMMIPVVMESGTRSSKNWRGEVGAALNGKVPIDISSDEDDVLEKKFDQLARRIKETIGGLIKTVSGNINNGSTKSNWSVKNNANNGQGMPVRILDTNDFHSATSPSLLPMNTGSATWSSTRAMSSSGASSPREDSDAPMPTPSNGSKPTPQPTPSRPATMKCYKTVRCSGGLLCMIQLINGCLAVGIGISSSKDYGIRVWDPVTWDCTVILSGHTAGVRSLTQMQDPSLLASASEDKTVRVWNLDTGDCLMTFTSMLGGYSEIARRMKGTIGGLIRSASSGSLKNSQKNSRNNSQKEKDPVAKAGVTVAITLSGTGAATLPTPSQGSAFTRTESSPAGLTLARAKSSTMGGGGATGTSNTVALAVAEKLSGMTAGHTGWVHSVIQLIDGRLASGSDDQTIKLWNVTTGECALTIRGSTGNLASLLQLADGRLVSGQWTVDFKLRMWDVNNGRLLKTFEQNAHTDTVRALTRLPNPNQFASASWDKLIKIWDVPTGKCLQTLVNTAAITCLTLLSNGHLASGDWDAEKAVRVWDLQKGECIEVLEGHFDDIRSVVELPDGRLASAAKDKTIKIWGPIV